MKASYPLDAGLLIKAENCFPKSVARCSRAPEPLSITWKLSVPIRLRLSPSRATIPFHQGRSGRRLAGGLGHYGGQHQADGGGLLAAGVANWTATLNTQNCMSVRSGASNRPSRVRRNQ